jgi:hypothetical protein
MPPASEQIGGTALPDGVAELLQKKILEFEQGRAAENEKTQKALKGRFRAAAKTKTKEAKQLLNNADMPDAEKVQALWSKLQSEDELARSVTEDSHAKIRQIRETDADLETTQAEVNRGHGVTAKLESLCRQLQNQTKGLVDERKQLTDNERLRRQELADEFQGTIGDVKRKMDTQANERATLAAENEDLRSRFKQFFEQYDKREKELLEQQKEHETEVQTFSVKLKEQAQLYRQEAAKENMAQRENDELNSQDQVLRGQLQTYSSKLHHFQDALSKSGKVLGQYKRQKNKMQRRVELLTKENADLRLRSEKRLAAVRKERDALLKEKELQQEKCKALQSERQALLEEQQKLEGTEA